LCAAAGLSRWRVIGCVAAGVALAALKPLPLSARVIQPGEFPGFLALPGQSTTLYKNPKRWVSVDKSLTPAQATARIARLRREGFVAVLSRRLGTPRREPYGGLSWVMQLRSAASARAELAANARDAARPKPPGTYTAFRVRGIPGARGYHLSSRGSAGDNVVFVVGRLCTSSASAGLPSRRTYRRAHSCSPPQGGCTSGFTGTRPRRRIRNPRKVSKGREAVPSSTRWRNHAASRPLPADLQTGSQRGRL
jgi:hypothetical protein